YWWALAANLVIQAFCLLAMVYKTNWQEEVKKARDRAGLLGELVIERIDRDDDCQSPLSIDPIQGIYHSSKSISPKSPSHLTGSRRRLLSASLTMSEVHVVVEESTEMTLSSVLCRRLACVIVMFVILAAGITCRLLFDVDSIYGDIPYNVSDVSETSSSSSVTVS
ncbi:hypothetical protein LSH36_281g10030, partial [Paralvinella palmiformis]